MKRCQLILLPLYLLLIYTCSSAQNKNNLTNTQELSDYTKSFIELDTPRIALTGVLLFDGSGNSPKPNQTVLIKNGIIQAVGELSIIDVPSDYYKIDLNGKTLIPGLIGMHNHMRIPQSAMLSTAPKLYLACGVTMIQTCGTGNPYEEIAINKSIKNGDQPGPEIINSGPYFTGPDGKSNFIRFTDENMIRDTIRYWANQGVKWLKVYRNTRPEDLKIIVDEAHKNKIKVNGHLCATTFAEAAEIGIDAIEHGFIHSYDFAAERLSDQCSGKTTFRSELPIDSDEVNNLQDLLIDKGVALTSTLSIFEAQASAEADQRDLKVMAPAHIEAYHHRKKRKVELGDDWYFKDEWLSKSMEFDLQYYRKGGLLVAGPDPGLHNMPGYGDQKNYELLIKAGFKAEEAIQVMTSNGAKLLERNDIGSIVNGKVANLVILNGDLSEDSKVIRNVDMVFKNGIAYDPDLLIKSVKGNVGSETDDLMTYLGQKEPGLKAEIFAPDLISKADRYEFGSAFSKNGREFFFGVNNNGISEIYYTTLVNGVWTKEEKLFNSDSISYNDPMLSPDEHRLYFISDRPLNSSETRKDIDLWYVERKNKNSPWSAPINLGTPINSYLDEYYASFTQDGSLYFSARDKAENAPRFAFDIYKSEYKDGAFQKPELLPAQINTDQYEADVFIAPDESYMIFCSIRKEGMGEGDLYISFKNNNGQWGEAINMEDINTEGHELCPFVSGNGKYFFYTSNKDIYWISTEIFNKYKAK